MLIARQMSGDGLERRRWQCQSGTLGMAFLGRARSQAGLMWVTRFHVGGDENRNLVERDETSPGDEDNEQQRHTQPKITTWEAGWNVTNAIQGIFVLGLPYALLQSGYMGLLLLPISALVCSYTSKILISCLYDEEGDEDSGEEGGHRRVRHTYVDVANDCCRLLCPRLGGTLVNTAQLVELTMTCILYLVVSSNLMCHAFPFLPLSPGICSAAAFLTLVPCILIRDLKAVSRLSFLCSLAQFLITFIVIGYCLCQAPRWPRGHLRLAVDSDRFLVAVGVIIFSYTSQIFLPALEGSMAERGDFSIMIDCTHAMAGVLKTAFSLLAFLTWGEETKEVVSDNLPAALRTMVNLCLLMKALLSYPLPFYAAAQLLQAAILKQGPESSDWHGLLLRGGLLFLTFIMALSVPRFSLLMGLTGSVTGAFMTLLLPALFHLQLKWAQLSIWHKLLDLMILLLGLLCSVGGVICSVRGLVQAFANG